MKTKAIVVLTAAMSSFVLTIQPAFAQGSLTPPGAPGPMMKTLDQLEPRTPISSAPYTITNPGSYYLATNLVCAVSNAIVIAANGVTLDLNGFTISSTVANAIYGGTAISLGDGLRDITIANGHIRGGVTNNGSGVYSGPGFGSGISFWSASAANVLVSRVSVSGCLGQGIYLGRVSPTVVESCTVKTVAGHGVVASIVKAVSASDCGGNAIEGDQVSECRGEASGYGQGVYGYNAQNCYGSSSSGSGVSTTIAHNCYGTSGSGYGVDVSKIAHSCYGYSSSGTGLRAQIANSCVGSSSSGTPQSITYKYNMP